MMRVKKSWEKLNNTCTWRRATCRNRDIPSSNGACTACGMMFQQYTVVPITPPSHEKESSREAPSERNSEQ
eukprot:6220227-Amphidinium_carterae.2